MDKKPLETSELEQANMADTWKPYTLSGVNRINHEKENILENKQKTNELEDSRLTPTQDMDSTVNHGGKFACANDSLALVKVKKVCNASISGSESQYFQTPLTEPMPSKFGDYKPTQRSGEKEIVIENKVTKCQGHVCTPFNFSFIGCDTQCDCDTSLNDSNTTVDGNFNESQKDRTKQTDQTLQEIEANFNYRLHDNKRVLNSQLSSVDVFDDSQTRFAKFKRVSHSKIENSQMISQGSQLKPELVSGTQYHLGLQSQFLNTQNNSQIQSTSVFNQTGLIVDSQFNQTGAIIDSQENGEASDGDIFEDSFNNSAILSQIDELDAKTNLVCQKSDSKRTTTETDPDVTSHTQSLTGSCNQRTTTSHRKRQRRKSSLDCDIMSIELEMQRRRGNNNINVSDSMRQNSAMKENSEAAKVLVSNPRNSITHSELSTIVNVEVNTELQRSGASDLVVHGDRETSLMHDSAVNIGGTKKNDKPGVESGNRRPTEPVTPVVGGTLQDRLRKKLQVAAHFICQSRKTLNMEIKC